MSIAFRLAFAACALAACSPAPAPDAVAPAPAPVASSADAYACADGTRVHVGFGAHDATVRWSDGRSVRLPRAESASQGGGDVYVGDTVSLQRDCPRLQLHDGARPATGCAAATPAGGGAPA